MDGTRVRILFISHNFPPEINAPASRTREHCRRWVQDGHDVTVITGVPNHPRGELFTGYENRWLQEERVDGIRVIRTWMFLAPNAGFVKRIANYVLFAATAILASFRAERPDVVISTSPQFFCGLAGAVVARLKRRPFVLEVRDLWPKSIVELGQLREGFALDLLERLERWMYHSADGIVINTRSFRDHLVARHYPEERIELVYNGIDPQLFSPRPASAELLAEYGLEGKFCIAYVGTLGLAHGLMTLLDTAELLREQRDIMLLLIGDGADRDRLETEIAERQLDNVRLLGLQPRERMPAWIASIDVLLVALRDLPVFETVIPSKIFEFLAQERPVILAAKGEIRDLINKAGAGMVVDPENAEQLAQAVAEIRRDPDAARERARAGRAWVEDGFIRDDLARRMLRFIERFTGGSA